MSGEAEAKLKSLSLWIEGGCWGAGQGMTLAWVSRARFSAHSRCLSGNLMMCMTMCLSAMWISFSKYLCPRYVPCTGKSQGKSVCPFPSPPSLHTYAHLSRPFTISKCWLLGLWFMVCGSFYMANSGWFWLKSRAASFHSCPRDPQPHQWFPLKRVLCSRMELSTAWASPLEIEEGWGKVHHFCIFERPQSGVCLWLRTSALDTLLIFILRLNQTNFGYPS